MDQFICQNENQSTLNTLENKTENVNENTTNNTRILKELENLKNTTDPKEIQRIKKRLSYWNDREKHLDRVKTWSQNNKSKKAKMIHNWYSENKEECLARQKRWRENNKEQQKAYRKRYRQENRENLNQYRNTNPNAKIAKLLRNRIRDAIKTGKKAGSAVKDLGCSLGELKNYLESKFQDGMDWNNHGMYGWHIDHIKPLSSFDLTNREQFLEACHYTNLQPLWWKDNITKGGVRK